MPIPEGGLMGEHDGRIPVPDASELRDDVARLLPLIAPPGREPARTMAVLARQPDLLSPFLAWAAALALQGVLPHRAHELLALRAASNYRSEFEWEEHVEYASAEERDDDVISGVGAPVDGGGWDESERALLIAVDELTAGFDITDETWATLSRHYEAPALVEILFVVGQYTMLSMVANAA